MIFEFVLPMATPSNNEIKRMHWAKYGRLRKDYTTIIRVLAAACPKCGGEEMRSVLITRHGSRLLDEDNLAGGCKPLIDAMVGLGLLVDDDPGHARLEFAQQKSSRTNAHTVVMIASAVPDAA